MTTLNNSGTTGTR